MRETKSNIKIIILSVVVLFLAGLCIYLIFFWNPNKITYHMENTRAFASCINDDEDGNFCSAFKIPNEVYYKYPVIDGKSKIIEELNKTIKDYINDRISSLEDITNGEGIPNTPCGKIKILKNNLFYSDSHFYYYEYRVINANRYISIILYEEVLSTCASSWTDIANVYIYDKKDNKLIAQKDLMLENEDKLIETATKNKLNELALEDIYKKELLDILSNKKYYLYYSVDDNLVISFSEPETNGVLVNYTYADSKWNKLES